MKTVLFSSLVGMALTLRAGLQSSGQAINVGDAADFSQSLAVSPGGTFTMKVDRGTVQITGADQETIGIRVQRHVTRASDAEALKILREEEVQIKQTGDTILIASQEPPTLRRSGDRPANLEVHFEITVPRKFDIHVETAGGNVKVAGVEGGVNLKTSGGGIDCENIVGTLGGLTSGGSIHARNCNSRLDLHTSGGDITIDGFMGPEIHAGTSGGSVSADLIAAPKADSGLGTSGGSVRVRLPGNAALNLDAHTTGGSVRTGLPVQVEGKLSEGNLKGTVNGGGPLLKLETSGADIEIIKG